jgi:hypothetical protein
MELKFAGKGNRRPQLDLPLNKISLDNENPRLVKQKDLTSQFDLLKTLYDEYDLEEIALSMSANGYFDEEPIIVVPKNPPAGLFDGDVTAVQQKLEKLVKENALEFTVVEGNRRIGTAKILLESDLRSKLKIRDEGFPKIGNEEIADDLRLIPSIVYSNREDVAPYLGVRHITGLLKWDAFAKAAYIAQTVEERIGNGATVEESIKTVQQQVADRSDVIRKQYLCFRIMKEAEDDLNFDTKKVKDKFSLLTVALNSPSIRQYIGSPTYRDANFGARIIPIEKIEHLRYLLTWIYGDGKKEPILSDSRRITKELAPVLSSKEATEYLIKNNNLEEAYERSEGERNYIVRKINTASNNIKFSLSFAWKYKKDQEIKDSVKECSSAISELQKMISSND